MKKSIERLRKKIDSIDKHLVQILSNRAKLSLQIGKIKLGSGAPVYAADREKQILKKLMRLNKGPLSDESVQSIYREIMSGMLSLEKPLKIAYLGPEASFSHLAAMKKFGSQVNYIATDSISDCFRLVDKDEADYSVVPIENSIEGAVSHTMDMFSETDLKICSQMILEVSHNLLARCRKSQIKKVYSNPQIFGQCRRWLAINLPTVELIEVSSSSKAAQIVAREKDSACIASELAAKIYNLNLIAKNIEDSPHNITRFLLIGRTDVAATGTDKTSIIFSIQDRVGALCDMLVPFKKYAINLTKIESRPSKKKAWDYYFFVDLEGHRDNPKVKRALAELSQRCKFLKILGSYPC